MVGGEVGAFQCDIMSQQQGFVLQCWDYSEWKFGSALLLEAGSREGCIPRLLRQQKGHGKVLVGLQ